MKDKCIEFVINVSRQGNIAKIKLNLKINLQILVEINGNTPGFCLVYQRHIHKPVKQIT